MKKLLYLFLCLFIFSCDNDDNNYNKEQILTIECFVNDDTIPVKISGRGLPVGGKYIKKYHRETVKFAGRSNISYYADCEDPKILITLKVFDKRNKLIQERSGNTALRIRVKD